ncbi:MAG: nucleotidyltransferase [Candidatus Korobacteraceae bacterium]|jgi:hypothetical protein
MATLVNDLETTSRITSLDEILFEVCDDLQLTENRHSLATQRYTAVGTVLESSSSPFTMLKPRIYPQGSMALGTTVKPVVGPHDLDFVLELSVSHADVDPMALIKTLFNYLKQLDRYSEMTELKNRCVRLVYADDFYMDILPACRDGASGGTCVQVPDRKVKSWKPSNPTGYIGWFTARSLVLEPRRVVLADAAPIPPLQATESKAPLQLAVQLLRWRDLCYLDQPDEAPISIVLTTLAARNYHGEASVSRAVSAILTGIQEEIAFAESRQTRVWILNPTNAGEDLSERWNQDEGSYGAFVDGINNLRSKWDTLLRKQGNPGPELKELFGETVSRVYEKRARRLQEQRRGQKLGVAPSGMISMASPSIATAKPNTFYGED